MLINKFFEIRDQVERLRLDLTELLHQEQSNYQDVLQKEIDILKKALDDFEVPELFRIAVVGTFNTGKSSFVNKLAEEKLAGVETNPETAAISIFRYAEVPRAEINLISLEDWQQMEDLYKDFPKHPEAYRVAGLKNFNVQDKNRYSQQKHGSKPTNFESVDIDQLVAKWLKPGGHIHVIKTEEWNTAGKKAFRKSITEFTSSRSPLHFFVKELVIYAPVILLKDHVELIDTPGLNDTQIYRGQLTEELLSQVDAILFLTRSDASFSQFDKDFLVRQLRKKRLKHLRLIVTQFDHACDNAIRDADEEDEERPTYQEIQGKEEARLRAEIRRTLDELLEDTDLKEEDAYYYIEQLDTLKIHFTSAKWFDEGKVEESGINSVRNALFEVISENYHLKQIVSHLENTLNAVRERLHSFFAERLSLLKVEFDPTKVNNNIEEIESKLKVLIDDFNQTMNELTQSHSQSQQILRDDLKGNISKMQRLAKSVIKQYRSEDIEIHWKARRYRNWGYLNDLGGRVADRIFPVMEKTLNSHLKEFKEFLDRSLRDLNDLQNKIEKIESDSAIEGLPKIEFIATNERFINTYFNEINEQVQNEKDEIIQLLEEFASGELKEQQKKAKDEIAAIEGVGTVKRQNLSIENFYDNIVKSLDDELRKFLEKRLDKFSTGLSINASNLFPKLRTSIHQQLRQRKQAIEERLRFQTWEARKNIENYLNSGLSILESCDLARKSFEVTDRKTLEERDFSIAEGETGFSYEIIFKPYLLAAERIEIKEPYLRLKYQLDNFQRFYEMIICNGTTKELKLITGSLDEDDQSRSDERLEKIRFHLQEYGIQMHWQRDSSLHSREIRTSDGWIILSDRGLDIYKKPENRNEFGHFDLALRSCKQTQIHVRRQLETLQ